MHRDYLIQAAVDTYEQALAWLGADASQADDTIVALYGVKVSYEFPAWLFATANNYPRAS
jgi:hypothetical protein